MKAIRARNKLDKENKRTLIMDTAIELFLSQSGKMPSSSEISRECNMTKGNLYTYFNSKEELYFEILCHQFELWFQKLNSLQDYSYKLDTRLFEGLYQNELLVGLYTLYHSSLKHNLKNNNRNSGFVLLTYNVTNNINLNTPLNIYAETIFHLIKEKSKYDITDPLRFYWNYYDSSSMGKLHQDMTTNGHYSIIYNLHTNDGGTEFFDGKKTFIKSKAGQAIIFPSEINHRGVAPKKLNHRFNLNIVTYSKEKNNE